MSELERLGAALDEYVKPYCHPIAVRMLGKGEPLPSRVKVPSRDFGHPIVMCQGWNMARRHGWSIAFTAEDMVCPIATIVMGFKPEPAFFSDGNLMLGMYVENRDAACRTEAETPKLAYGSCESVVFAPLSRATFDPHVVAVYGNSAQVMRLVQAALYRTGGRMTSAASGRADCAELFAEPFLSGECQVILPCNGDRVFGQTQDHEMAFAIPAGKIAGIIDGLEGTHKSGVRYPIPTFLSHRATMPPKYEELMQMLSEAKD